MTAKRDRGVRFRDSPAMQTTFDGVVEVVGSEVRAAGVDELELGCDEAGGGEFGQAAAFDQLTCVEDHPILFLRLIDRRDPWMDNGRLDRKMLYLCAPGLGECPVRNPSDRDSPENSADGADGSDGTGTVGSLMDPTVTELIYRSVCRV